VTVWLTGLILTGSLPRRVELDGRRMKFLPKLERRLRRLKKKVSRPTLVRKLDLVHERWVGGETPL